MVAAFQSGNIDGRVFFHPLSTLPSFGSRAGQLVAADIARRAVNLPSFHDMTDAQIERVAGTVKAALHARC
jgi:perosamine synthetase